MKWLFFLLLLANLLFFGYTRLAEPQPPLDWRNREVNAAKLRIAEVLPASPSATPPVDAAAGPAADSPVSASDALEAQAPVVAEVAAAGKACFAWRGILTEDLPNVRKRVAALKLGGETKLESSGGEGPVRYWVLIPPRGTTADAQKKADELKLLGVTDFFIINDDKRYLNAVSLGLFSTKEAAERRLDSLRQQGVRTAMLRERREGAPVSNTLLLKQVPSSAKAQLNQAATAFRGSTITSIGC